MRVRLFAFGMVCIGLGASGATVANAQVGPAAPPDLTQRAIHARLGVIGIYDDNFARASKAVAAQRGINPNEYTVRPRAIIDAVQPVGRQVVYLKGSAGYDFHRENPQLDRVNGAVEGGVAIPLGFCQTLLSAGYSALQSDLSDIDDVSVENLAERTSLGAGAECGRPRGLKGALSVQHIETDNSAPLQGTANSQVNAITALIGYANPTFGELGVTYNYSDSNFPNRVYPGRGPGDGFYSQTVGVSAERRFGTRLNLGGTIGRTMVKREFAPAGTPLKFNSTSYSATADYRLGSRWNFNGTISRAVIPSARAGKLYDISTAGQLSADYKLGSAIVLTAGRQFDRRNSNADTTIARQVVTRSRTNTTFGSITYKRSERLNVVADVRYAERTTNLPDFDYNALRVSLSLEVGF